MPRFLLFCRAGFEKDCAAEAHERFAARGWDGDAQALEPHGLVGYQGEYHGESYLGRPPVPTLKQLIFCRQMLSDVSLVSNLPADDRATPLAEAFAKALPPASPYRALVLEHPDTNEGRSLANFCKKFAPALGNAMRRVGLDFQPQSRQAPALHIVFLSYEKAYIGLETGPRQLWKGGIPRLKFPEAAPSRSTLKLEEAFLTLLDDKERTALLGTGNHAVDLGAAPGGWTYQLLDKSYFVTAVDNGEMDEKLLATGMVDHRQEDAYRYAPKQAIDLLVCDMIDKPQRVTSLVARWFQNKQCRWAVFNLKLPMKKRYDESEICFDLFWKESGLSDTTHELRAKHLYHNREEITLLVNPRRL